MITFKNNFKKILTPLLEMKNYNSITRGIIAYLNQPYITVFGYFAILENYSIINQESIKKHLITLLIDMTTELQKDNFLTTDIIENLQTVKKLFSIADEDFERYTKDEVLSILSIQGTRIESQFAKATMEVEHNFAQLKQLFGVKEEPQHLYSYSHLHVAFNSSCTPS